jgi:hypothetical protein
LSFTRAALLDPQLEDISIVLENGLIGTRFWLPRHQEIEIRRTGTWFDYPVRGIIRGRWEVSDYQLNEKIPAVVFTGPEFQQMPAAVLKAYPWHGGILDSLPPDVAVTSDADVRRVQAEARALVREQALNRAEETRLSARGLSDFATVNRVQGLAVGAGVEQHLAAGFSVAARPQFGIDDRTLRGSASLDWANATGTTVSLYARRVLADARDEPERSGIINSLAAQEFGSDATEPYDLEAAGLTLRAPWMGLRWTLGAAAERHEAVSVHARPALGGFAPTIAATDYSPVHVSVRAERDAADTVFGIGYTWAVQLDAWHAPEDKCPLAGTSSPCAVPPPVVHRGSVIADAARAFGPVALVSHTDFAVADAGEYQVAAQQLVYFGGPVTAPGYPLHGLVGSRGVSQRVEARIPVPFYGFSLGTFGRAPARATLAPFYNVVSIDPAAAPVTVNGITRDSRLFPSLGVGLIGFFDLVRLDVARGLLHDGRWTFSIDFAREFWGIL